MIIVDILLEISAVSVWYFSGCRKKHKKLFTITIFSLKVINNFVILHFKVCRILNIQDKI